LLEVRHASDMCINLHESCVSWADRGECTSNKDYMMKNCARACSICGLKFYYTGPDTTRDDGSTLLRGERGQVVGPASLRTHFRKGLRMRFGGSIIDVDIYLEQLSSDPPLARQEPPPPPPGCSDRDQSGACAAWAAAGVCEERPIYMNTYCARTCDTCDESKLLLYAREAFNDPVRFFHFLVWAARENLSDPSFLVEAFAMLLLVEMVVYFELDRCMYRRLLKLRAAAVAARGHARRTAAMAANEAEAARRAEALLAELEEDRKTAERAKASRKGQNKKAKARRTKGGGGGTAGPPQESEEPAAEEAKALEESARPEEGGPVGGAATPGGPSIISLADANISTGRPAVPESTVGGQTTCIVCFTNPKSHIATPCGHVCACGLCSVKMDKCPICRAPVDRWFLVHVA